MDTSSISKIINITIPGISPSQYSWTATKTAGNIYRIDI